jgi:hypothetical protein
LFDITKEEQFVGDSFAKIFNLKYFKNNNDIITNVDGHINSVYVELQNLKFSKSLINKTIIIDSISAFKFKNDTRRTIKLTDNDITIQKYGKLFTLNNEDLYLVYLKKTDLIENKVLNKYNQYLQDENFVFLPLKMEKIKKIYNQNGKHLVNNKKKYNLNDNWESAFIVLNICNDILYTKNELDLKLNLLDPNLNPFM